MSRTPHALCTTALAASLTLAACSPTFKPAYPEPAQPAANAAAKEAPAPRPEPAVDRFEICALAPATPAGLRSLPAVHVHGTADTLAVVDGRRVPLSEAVGPVTVAGDKAWFTAGRTLDITVGGRTVHYGLYDRGRIIDAADLAYLGTSGGLPVYVAATDVQKVRDELARRLASGHDLATLLAASASLRAAFRQVQVLYVPVRSTGCIFQPLLRTDLR